MSNKINLPTQNYVLDQVYPKQPLELKIRQLIQSKSDRNFALMAKLLQPIEKPIKLPKPQKNNESNISTGLSSTNISPPKENKDKLLQQELRTMKFSENGWWLTYRDSNNKLKDPQTSPKSHHVIIAICGLPGSLKYYQVLEKFISPSEFRLINVYFPGLDGFDERRGTYNGSIDNIAAILNAFMEKMNIPKANLLMHSYGGMLGKYFATCYPHRVGSFIQMASVPLEKWVGWQRYEQINEKVMGLSNNLTVDDLNNDEFRKEIFEKQLGLVAKIKTMDREQQEIFVQILHQSQFDYVNALKLQHSFPGGVNEVFRRIRYSVYDFPRFIAYSSIDKLVEGPLVEEEIMAFVLGKEATKLKLSGEFAPQVDFDRSNYSSNFIFKYDNASHMLHHEKGRDLAQMIKVFLQGLDLVEMKKAEKARL